MSRQQGIASGLGGLLVLMGSVAAIAHPLPIGAIAQAEPSSPAATETPEAATETVPETGFRLYTLPESFAIQIPEDWLAVGGEGDRTAVITSYRPDRAEGDAPQPADLHTEITLFGEHPDIVVDREIEALIEQAYPVQRYRPVRVNDRTALRLWIAEPPTAYDYQIITFVGYASYGTARIVTQYNAATPETEALIEQVHDSFELVF